MFPGVVLRICPVTRQNAPISRFRCGMDKYMSAVRKTPYRAKYKVIFCAGMKNRDNHCGLPLPL